MYLLHLMEHAYIYIYIYVCVCVCVCVCVWVNKRERKRETDRQTEKKKMDQKNMPKTNGRKIHILVWIKIYLLCWHMFRLNFIRCNRTEELWFKETICLWMTIYTLPAGELNTLPKEYNGCHPHNANLFLRIEHSGIRYSKMWTNEIWYIRINSRADVES